MGVVSVSSTAAFGLSSTFLNHHSSPTKTIRIILAFKTDKTKNTALVSSTESVDTPKENPKRLRRMSKKPSERVHALSTLEAPYCSLDLDYLEAAAELNRLYKLSPTTTDSDDTEHQVKRSRRGMKKVPDNSKKPEMIRTVDIVRGKHKKFHRLTLENRIHLKNKKDVAANQKRKQNEDEKKISARLVRDHYASTDLGSLDWKKMKIPPVLPSSEHTRLFKLLQTMKATLKVKEELWEVLEREPTDGELAEATNMNTSQLRKIIAGGQAARNKLIKHNLRLVLFVMNKYFQEFANFQDLCQAGVKGLMTAIDRFEPGRKLQLSTYALFWIRHAIIRSMTLSSFFKVPFGLESVKIEIQKAKKKLWFEHTRPPTEEEIARTAGISLERYREVTRASRPILSLNRKNPVTQEEFINTIAEDNDERRQQQQQPALLRLALDDVLDSLKPKESLVMRQRYGLDGKGNRTLGEIASNLNISREMVRKHEVKALMKLKHPARLEYLRHYLL